MFTIEDTYQIDKLRSTTLEIEDKEQDSKSLGKNTTFFIIISSFISTIDHEQLFAYVYLKFTSSNKRVNYFMLFKKKLLLI